MSRSYDFVKFSVNVKCMGCQQGIYLCYHIKEWETAGGKHVITIYASKFDKYCIIKNCHVYILRVTVHVHAISCVRALLLNMSADWFLFVSVIVSCLRCLVQSA
jgi:hypothetical protein